MKMAFTIVRTIGFANELDIGLQAKIISHALQAFKVFYPPTDMIVYYPHRVNPHFEDDNRTLITSMDGLTKKVYVKIYDYGNPEEWDTLYDEETVKELKESGIQSRYVIAFMLAEEY